MDAVEYLKTIKRMCELHKPMCWGEDNHTPCELRIKANAKGMTCCDYTTTFSKEAVEIVEKWAKEHPIKTRQSEFLKSFPDARLFDGVLAIDPCKINSSRFDSKECRTYCDEFGVLSCDKCREQFWNEEIE